MADAENANSNSSGPANGTGAVDLENSGLADSAQSENGAPENAADEGGKDDQNAGGDGASGGKESDQDQQSPDDLPISDWSKVDLDLPKDAAIDEAVLASFGEQAKALGLTPKQARGLAAWQLETAKNARADLMEAGIAELRKDWGAKAQKNQQAVLALISRIDRKMDGAFSKALDASGATCDAAVCKGLLEIASMLSEDSMGGPNGGAGPQKPETALEGIENAYREMRGKM